MARAPLGAALVACALALVADVGRPSASPGRCRVQYRQRYTPEAKAVELRLASRCAFAVSCELSWEVVCDDGDPVDAVASLTLPPRGAAAASASIAGCDGDWEVRGVRWSCDEVR